jgi:hypothetical protein
MGRSTRHAATAPPSTIVAKLKITGKLNLQLISEFNK